MLPADVPWHPPQQATWPKTHGPQTARVVGPAGESIWTDKYGRIKVKFHWDRFGPKDDGSSCWVRVSSAWAGQGYGGVQIPRVNDEVVVDFINGDPDRPIVTGRVYNEASMPPWALPAAATQMGFMSRTKDGTADNANALRFEDKAGAEQVWIQAERNMDTQVKNDESHTIANDHTHLVGGNQIKRVVLNQATGVKGDASALTGKTRSDAVVNAFTLGSGESLRLECGESVIELLANGQINITGTSFNITVKGDGAINTGGQLDSTNPAAPRALPHRAAAIRRQSRAPSISCSRTLRRVVRRESRLTPPLGRRRQYRHLSRRMLNRQQNPAELIIGLLNRSWLLKGAGEQGGRRELYGFRQGNGTAYDKILAARNQYGQGSAEEFEEVSKAMSASAKSAGALNFTDPGKQGAITSLAHMRGSSGAQAILNSMESGRIVKADTLTPEAISKIESMSSENFQDNLLKARVEYDKAIYGNTITTQGGKQYNWWARYGNGLQKRYAREAEEFLKLSSE